MILTGNEIKIQQELGNLFIEDFDERRLGPNSYNLRLAPELLVYDQVVLDAKKENRTKMLVIPGNGLVLKPGQVYLARTMEWTETNCFVPMLEGRSSIGRLGMSVHVSAGFGDLGFSGCWTLEITVTEPVRIYPEMEICQIYYLQPKGEITKLYRGKYQGQTDIRPSELFRDFTGEVY